MFFFSVVEMFIMKFGSLDEFKKNDTYVKKYDLMFLALDHDV